MPVDTWIIRLGDIAATWGTALIVVSLKTTVLLVLAMSILRCIRRLSATMRHFVLFLALTSPVILVLVPYVLPQWRSPITNTIQQIAYNMPNGTLTSTHPHIPAHPHHRHTELAVLQESPEHPSTDLGEQLTAYEWEADIVTHKCNVWRNALRTKVESTYTFSTCTHMTKHPTRTRSENMQHHTTPHPHHIHIHIHPPQHTTPRHITSLHLTHTVRSSEHLFT